MDSVPTEDLDQPDWVAKWESMNRKQDKWAELIATEDFDDPEWVAAWEAMNQKQMMDDFDRLDMPPRTYGAFHECGGRYVWREHKTVTTPTPPPQRDEVD